MRKVLCILVVILLVVLNAVPVLADTTAIVTILGVPAYSGGILTFNITYISDTELDLSWTVGSGVANVMVRSKYSSYPANPPNSSTAPSDGHLVYYGSDLSTVDTSMDMSQNAGTLYYSAWAQHADGSWYVVASTKSEESRDVILATLFGVLALGAIAFTALGYTKRQPILALFGAAFFLMMGGFAVSQTVTQWDVWYDLMFVSFIFGGLVAMVAFSLERTERAVRRTKAAADKAEKSRPRTTAEQWAINQQEADDMYHQTHLPRARRSHKSA